MDNRFWPTRWSWAWVVLGTGMVLATGTYVAAEYLSDRARESLVAVGTVMAAVAAAAAAAGARSAALSSAETSRRATLALARHRTPWVCASINRQRGRTGGPWSIYLYRNDDAIGTHAVEPVRDVRVEWLAAGRTRTARRDVLESDPWDILAGLEDATAAGDIHRLMGSVSITYDDSDRLVRWRTRATVTEHTSTGMFNPPGTSERFYESESPGVNNTLPEALP